MKSILMIDDSVETQMLLTHALKGQYEVTSCYDLMTAKELLKGGHYDLIILDLILPDGEGISLFNELCAGDAISSIPVIILSSLADMGTKVSGLNLGADDYLIKPFETSELLARINTVLRRGVARQSESLVTVGDLLLDLDKQILFKVQKDGVTEDLRLTPTELKILNHLRKNQDSPISRQVLKVAVWGKVLLSERNIDAHISKLRGKLHDCSVDILNRRGKGYYLEIKDANASFNKPENVVPLIASSRIFSN